MKTLNEFDSENVVTKLDVLRRRERYLFRRSNSDEFFWPRRFVEEGGRLLHSELMECSSLQFPKRDQHHETEECKLTWHPFHVCELSVEVGLHTVFLNKVISYLHS
jgi:hypothetical protein